MKSLIALSLAWCLLLASPPISFAQQGGMTAAQKSIAKIKQKVIKIGVGEKVTVQLANNAKIYGTVKNIEEDRFYIAEVDRVNLAEINFSDVKKVSERYCPPNLFTGKRDCPSRRNTAIIGIAVAVGSIAAVAYALSQTK